MPKNTEEEQKAANSEAAYLEIKEWGVKVALPKGTEGAVTYELGEVVADPDNNLLQSANIFVLASLFPDNDHCTLHETQLGPSIDLITQYIRSESAKPFDAARYRFNFEVNILKTDQYNYHLNHVGEPPCLDGFDKVRELQAALENLERMD